MSKFKITNSSNGLAPVILIASVLLGAIIYAGFLNLFEGRPGFEMFFGLLVIPLAVIAGLLILSGRQAEVEYDGDTIKLKTFYGKKEIDLSKIQTVSYEFIRGYGRGSYDTICLTLTYFESGEETPRSENLYDMATSGIVDNLIKGDYTGFPLLQMYKDIVRKYPEKKG